MPRCARVTQSGGVDDDGGNGSNNDNDNGNDTLVGRLKELAYHYLAVLVDVGTILDLPMSPGLMSIVIINHLLKPVLR